MNDEELNDYEKAIARQRLEAERRLENRHPISNAMKEITESVSGQSRYDGGELEAIVVIEALGMLLARRGVDPKKVYALQQVVRYIWRLGAKDAMDTELGKAENYIHRARTGEWLEK